MKCILLCAGYATRLFPLTENFPKALLEIEEKKPLLDYILDEVNTIPEIDQIYLVTNHRYASHFMDWANQKMGKPITVIDDHTTSNDDRLGAIGDITYTLHSEKVQDDIMIIAGDNLFDYSLKDVVSYFQQKKAPVVCAKKLEDLELLKRFAVAKIDSDNRILNLVEKPTYPESDIGVYATYLYPKEILSRFDQYLAEGNKPDAPGYFVEYLYKQMPVYVYPFEGNCYDVGTFESLEEVRSIYQSK